MHTSFHFTPFQFFQLKIKKFLLKKSTLFFLSNFSHIDSGPEKHLIVSLLTAYFLIQNLVNTRDFSFLDCDSLPRHQHLLERAARGREGGLDPALSPTA